ncbi:hypothetical protein AQJ46_50490 [Streptomyces canus]|uniref:Uncharacterized protein n=1 Tax=Streptomyces canus TaxID=58343 RepID=A0A117QVS8_9ACTN|nr:hypothetical protein AQJ46_50490 [Streptomyces canus]
MSDGLEFVSGPARQVGATFLADEARGAGASMADRTAWRICRDNRWWSVFGKKRGQGPQAGPPVRSLQQVGVVSTS